MWVNTICTLPRAPSAARFERAIGVDGYYAFFIACTARLMGGKSFGPPVPAVPLKVLLPIAVIIFAYAVEQSFPTPTVYQCNRSYSTSSDAIKDRINTYLPTLYPKLTRCLVSTR